MMRPHQKAYPALFFPSPALPLIYLFFLLEFPAGMIPNKLAPNVPNNILRNPSFCYFVLFSIVWVALFINWPESSRYLTIFIISNISSIDIINAVVPDPKNFLCIPVSTADTAAVNPNGIKTFLANGWSSFFIIGKPVFSYGLRSFPRNPSECVILDSWVFARLILAVKLFAKDLERFATCLLVNNNLCGKLVSPLELLIMFDDNLEATSVSFIYCWF